MSGNLWKVSHLLDDQDILFAQHDYITIKDGCEYYGLGYRPFVNMARAAESVLKIGKMVRVDRKKFEEYLRATRRISK